MVIFFWHLNSLIEITNIITASNYITLTKFNAKPHRFEKIYKDKDIKALSNNRPIQWTEKLQL